MGDGSFSHKKHEGELHYGVNVLSQVTQSTNHGGTETVRSSSTACCKLFVAELFLGRG